MKKLYLKTIETHLSDSNDCYSKIISITSNPSTFLNSKNLAQENLGKINNNLNQSKNTKNAILTLNNNSPLDINTTNNAIITMQQYYDNSLQAINKANDPCLKPNQDHMNFGWVGGVARYWDDTRSNKRDNRGWGKRFPQVDSNRYRDDTRSNKCDPNDPEDKKNRDCWYRQHYDSASHPNCPTSEYGW